MEWPILEMKTPWPLVNVEEEDGELVVHFHAEAFLWPTVEEVGRILLTLVDETEGSSLVLDFGAVDRVSGIGLEKLARLHRKLAMQGGKLAIRNAGLPLRQRLAFAKDIHADDDMPLGNPWHGYNCPQELEGDPQRAQRDPRRGCQP
jgi:MFS superfamily sulfate permease-like transporter